MPPNGHALLSASAAYRWLKCPPSARLCESYDDKGSDYAAEGTDAHELCEYKLKKALGLEATNPTKHLARYSEEMEDCANGYVSYVLEQVEVAKESCTDPVVLIEHRVDFSRWVEQGFGTADCIIIADGTLRICDYKHGIGVLVSADDNPQMMCYALGALELFDDIYDIDNVSMTIYQPRRENISTFEIAKDKLYKWADEVLKPTADLAFAGEGNFLCGEWCGFCKAKYECRARAEANLISQQDGYIPPKLYNDTASYKPKDFSDVGQAEVLAKHFSSELRYSPATHFIRYSNHYWQESEPGAQAVAHELTRRQLKEANNDLTEALDKMKNCGAQNILDSTSRSKAEQLMNDEQLKVYEKYQSAKAYHAFAIKRRDSKNITSTLKESRPMLEISPKDLDADCFALCTPKATYDLRKGMVGAREHSPEDFITKITSVSPSQKGMQLWLDSLKLIFQNNQELIDYVQMICGLAVIGKVYVEALIIAYGDGRNGKSTFWNSISRVLGLYSGNISADTLTVGCRRNIKPEMAEIKGKRLLIAAEMQEGARLNDSTVKQLCSTDDIFAEKKYKDPFSFTPCHTLVLYTNHLPRVSATDRLMCGDATSSEDVSALMGSTKANLILTDPPYGVSFKSSSGLTIQNDSMKNEEFYNFLLASFKCMAEHLENGGSAYVFHADTEGLNFRKAFIDAGFHLAGCCIWVKDSLVLGRSDYQWQHEPVLYGFMQNGKHKWYSDRKQTTIWNFDKPKRNANHPTSKPLDLLSYPIGNSTQENCVVIDTFGGSGSTMMACEQMNRICYMMELDEKYASVILRRYVENTNNAEGVFVERNGRKIPYTELVKEVERE